MPGVRTLRSFAPEELPPPVNLWEVLERGRKDTFSIHTALWLFKNAQGGKGAFGRLPGPMFGYRTREREARHAPDEDPGVVLQALAWFHCLPAYGKGYLAADSPVYLTFGGRTSPSELPPPPWHDVIDEEGGLHG